MKRVVCISDNFIDSPADDCHPIGYGCTYPKIGQILMVLSKERAEVKNGYHPSEGSMSYIFVGFDPQVCYPVKCFVDIIEDQKDETEMAQISEPQKLTQ